LFSAYDEEIEIKRDKEWGREPPAACPSCAPESF